MTERTKTGLEILRTAAIIGLFGNIMLRAMPWGLNAFLFVTAFVTALFFLTRKYRRELLTTNGVALMAAMIFFAAMFVLRDAEELKVYDTLAIIGIMGVLVLGPLNINARLAGAFHYVCGFIWAGLSSLFAPVAIAAADIDWKQMPGTPGTRTLFSVLRGLAIALPLLLIFGALFAAADENFQAMVNRVVNFDLGLVVSHVVVTSVLAWLSAGYFRSSLVSPAFATGGPQAPASGEAEAKDTSTDGTFVEKVAAEPGEAAVTLPENATVLEHINRSDPPNASAAAVKAVAKKRDWQNIDSSSIPPVFTLGPVETVMILGLVDLLFITFVSLQVPYLFGGMDFVRAADGVTLAEYARRGFGELVVVAALVLPMLLVSHWLLRKEARRVEAIFRVLAGIQVALVLVIMASAVQRLVILTGESGYGMTTVRFYPLVFMIWLAVVFGWFVLTVLRGARDRFAWGALWAAIVILGGTNLMNPHAFIARTNIELMNRGREFDVTYNAGRLSSDAVPTLLAAIPEMNHDDACAAKWNLHDHYRRLGEDADLRVFNFSRRSAFYMLRANDAALHELEGCPAWMQPPD